ncbi:hypothetical protein M4438_05825 [Streptomyces lavenduligriseus]|uniref:Uncharacterized protein n=1 Tax=Streptomyces lavenduligriseus TaxID=67315 RepID=A0ABT0NPI7_9ACTN|nr:hypothetical protein [Streptomyces lavenduligriseus]
MPGTVLLLAASPVGRGRLVDAAGVLPVLAAVAPAVLSGADTANVVELADPLEPQAVLTRLRAAAAAPGPLTVYLTGQLHLDRRQHLPHLALARTTAATVRYTALPWHWIREELRLRSAADTAFVVDLHADPEAWKHITERGLDCGPYTAVYGRVAPPTRRGRAEPAYMKTVATLLRSGHRPPLGTLHEQALSRIPEETRGNLLLAHPGGRTAPVTTPPAPVVPAAPPAPVVPPGAGPTVEGPLGRGPAGGVPGSPTPGVSAPGLPVPGLSAPWDPAADRPGNGLGDRPGDRASDPLGDRIGDQPGGPSGDRVGDRPGGPSGDRPGEPFGAWAGDPSGDPPGDRLGDQPDERLGDRPGGPPGDRLDDRFGDQAGDPSGDWVGERVGGSSGDRPGDRLDDRPGETFGEPPGYRLGHWPGGSSGDRPGHRLDDRPGATSGDPSGESVGRVIAGADPHAAISAAVQGGLHREADGLAARHEEAAVRAYGAGSEQALHWREVRADLAMFAGDPVRSCRAWLAVAEARLAAGQAADAPAVEAAVDRAHHQWGRIEDPARARELGTALAELRLRVPGRRRGALEDIQRQLGRLQAAP